MQGRIDGEKLLDALDRVTWYNGLAEVVLSWKELPVTMNFLGHSQMEKPDYICTNPQLEVIWMIAVSLFGDYGTSPRSGWITDVEGFFAFIDRITTTYREWRVNFQTGK